jgi:uncharacterized caspase-like protein
VLGCVKAAGEGTISFFYYSGHGAAAPPNTPGAEGNYIIPRDVDSPTRPDFWSRAVALDQVNKILQTAPFAKHIVIFDACRTQLNLPGKDIAKGFDPPLLSQDVEMLTAFATAPRRTAKDEVKEGDFNGPYALAFAENLLKPGLDHLRLFSNVRRGEQCHWQAADSVDARWPFNSSCIVSGGCGCDGDLDQ